MTTIPVDEYRPHDDLWRSDRVNLKMHSARQGHTTRFSVLFQGPNGAARKVFQGPLVPGPWAQLSAQPTVIALHATGTEPTVIDVEVGDEVTLVLPDGREFTGTVRDDHRYHNPYLHIEEQ